MGPTRWYATLRIIHISVEGELLTKVVNARPDRGSGRDRWRHLGAPLPMALAMVTVSQPGSRPFEARTGHRRWADTVRGSLVPRLPRAEEPTWFLRSPSALPHWAPAPTGPRAPRELVRGRGRCYGMPTTTSESAD